jgi:hypothetical protein
MSKGQAKNGFRLTKGRAALLAQGYTLDQVLAMSPVKSAGVIVNSSIFSSSPNEQQKTVVSQAIAKIEKEEETDEQIEARLEECFSAMKDFVDMVGADSCPALVISGPAGIGKSFCIQNNLHALEHASSNFVRHAGYARATALFKMLYRAREQGSVILLDDIDSIILDETSLNLLKAATDSSEIREISWGSEYKFEDEDGESIPLKFQFEGSIIIITNLDLDAMIEKGNKISEHLAAIRSRAIYLRLRMLSHRDYIVHIRNVVYKHGMLDHLDPIARADVMSYVEEHIQDFRDMSLRTPKKIAAMREAQPERWKTLARVTCHRN